MACDNVLSLRLISYVVFVADVRFASFFFFWNKAIKNSQLKGIIQNIRPKEAGNGVVVILSTTRTAELI